MVEYNVSLKVTNLFIFWKPIATVTSCKGRNPVQFQIRFVIFVVASALTEKAAWEMTVHDSVFNFEGHRYPIINSGDTVALRSAYTASTSWLHCHKSHGDWHSCQGSTILTSTGWTSCSTLTFTITARGKSDGEPINSGDTASLSSNSYGSSYRLYCSASSSTHCTVQS